MLKSTRTSIKISKNHSKQQSIKWKHFNEVHEDTRENGKLINTKDLVKINHDWKSLEVPGGITLIRIVLMQ